MKPRPLSRRNVLSRCFVSARSLARRSLSFYRLHAELTPVESPLLHASHSPVPPIATHRTVAPDPSRSRDDDSQPRRSARSEKPRELERLHVHLRLRDRACAHSAAHRHAIHQQDAISSPINQMTAVHHSQRQCITLNRSASLPASPPPRTFRRQLRHNLSDERSELEPVSAEPRRDRHTAVRARQEVKKEIFVWCHCVCTRVLCVRRDGMPFWSR